MAKRFTFFALGKNGKKYYPRELITDQIDPVSNWTENKEEAVLWESLEDFDCLMNEYYDTEIEEVETEKDLIRITDASLLQSFISFKIKGLKDGISVGIVADPKSHGQALSIAYRGEVKVVPFSANTALIEKINNGEIQ